MHAKAVNLEKSGNYPVCSGAGAAEFGEELCEGLVGEFCGDDLGLAGIAFFGEQLDGHLEPTFGGADELVHSEFYEPVLGGPVLHRGEPFGRGAGRPCLAQFCRKGLGDLVGEVGGKDRPVRDDCPGGAGQGRFQE